MVYMIFGYEYCISTNTNQEINMANITNDIRFIRLPSVQAKVGLSRSQIYKLIDEGRFPAQVRLSARTVAWVEGQINEWMFQRTAA
jgi:prophage regulatory protein